MKKIDTACIIDDDSIFIFGAKHMMKISNFSKSLLVFKNGKEAIESLKTIFKQNKNVPDIILLDINMPIMDGWQFLDEFEKLNYNTTKIFMVSSSIDPIDINRAKKYNTVVDYILKPISIDKIKKISKTYSEL